MSDLRSFQNIEAELEEHSYINCRETDVVSHLYQPCLVNAVRFVRGAGYFRSSVYHLMTADLLRFCIAGGTIDLVTSTQLHRADYQSMIGATAVIEDLEELLKSSQNQEVIDATKMLCALVHHGHLRVFIAVLREGIYHEKKGFFVDAQGAIVAFDGSGNETYSALAPTGSGNAESFNVSWSWDPRDWALRGSKWKRELDRAVNQDESLTFPVERLEELSADFLQLYDIDADIETHLPAAQERQVAMSSAWDRRWGKRAVQSTQSNDFGLRDYQKSGLAAWRLASRKGTLEFATGSGKTRTAIAAINEHLHGRDGHVLVLVPGEALLAQWDTELTELLPSTTPIFRLGGGHSEGLDVFRQLRTESVPNTVIVAIIHSFRSPDVLRIAKRLFASQRAKPFLVVVDECHKIGASSFANLCQLVPESALGLSATPEREGDPEGTARMRQLLGHSVAQFGLSEALEQGYLCPYEYHIEFISLSEEEQSEYDELMDKIARMMAMFGDGADMPEPLKLLIFKARRLIRSAEAKVPLAIDLVRTRFERGQRWLVYCDSTAMLDEVVRRLNAARASVGNLNHVWTTFVYHSGLSRSDRATTLQRFASEGGVLCAIKCLDEGVDIPSITHGIVLSSSKTKREFIQRRGRMLRLSPNKTQAEIFDAFALPGPGAKRSTAMILSEIARALEFGSNALNRVEVTGTLELKMIEYDIPAENILSDRESDDDTKGNNEQG